MSEVKKQSKKIDVIMIAGLIFLLISLIVFLFFAPKETKSSDTTAHSIADLLEETGFYENKEAFEKYKK